MAKHTLQTNIPVTGTVKYLDYYPPKKIMYQGKEIDASAQIRLKGTWDGIGDAEIYLPDFLVNDIIGSGLAESMPERDGKPQFKWLYHGTVQVLKAEEGRSKRTSVLPLDAVTAAPAAPPQTGYEQARQAVAPRPVAAAPSAPPNTTVAVAAASVFGDPWQELARTYERAHVLACKVWGDNYEPAALVAAAATIFIEANKRGLKANDASSYAAMPNAISREEKMPWD